MFVKTSYIVMAISVLFAGVSARPSPDFSNQCYPSEPACVAACVGECHLTNKDGYCCY